MALKLITLPAVTVATAGTAQTISSSRIASMTVLVQASKDNTGRIYVGDENVNSTNGNELDPGEAMEITPEEIGGSSEEVIISDIFVDAQFDSDIARISFLGRRPVGG